MINTSKKAIKLSIALLLLTVIFVFISLSLGKVIISPFITLKSILGFDEGFNSILINQIRLPRVIVAFLVGASLSLSGAILQGIIKNPLASPDIIGIVDAGSVGTLIFLTLFTDPKNNSLKTSIFYSPVFAFVFCFLSLGLLYLLTKKGASTPMKLVLVGIGISSIFKGIRSILIINGPVVFIKEASTWITGTIYGVNWTQTILLACWFSIFFILSMIFIKELNLHTLDDLIVASLGSNTSKSRFVLLAIAAALTSGAVAIGGGISFVGLIAPHISRKLIGSKFENLIPVSVLTGGIITLLADMLSKWAFYPLDLPIGVFTASVGAPYFIYLLISSRHNVRGKI
ncbi:iron ABC transporter permease [Clostridium zeae]|uniref:Iron ABC transporter permease n=1 Tax=Clostridium zeae TaxID=2759022 RepID=A0ABQ1EHT2_9CLOT|nr:iron ABC transporter permease [Clostridium zeae]GFZ34388.1 iron ABC transporter permease [Clostridium zeae]